MDISPVSSSGTATPTSLTASVGSKIEVLNRQIAVIEGSGLDEDTIQSQVSALQSQIDALKTQLSSAKSDESSGTANQAVQPTHVNNQAPGADSSTTTQAQSRTSTSLYEWYA